MPKATENDNINKQLNRGGGGGAGGGGEWCVYACVVVKMSATDRIVLMDVRHTSVRHLW